MNHKYKLGQRIKLVNNDGDLSQSYEGKFGIVISLALKSSEFYASDYCVALEGCYDGQYGKPKLKKVHTNEANLVEVNQVKAYCYKVKKEFVWRSSTSVKTKGYRRVPSLDFVKDLEE